MRAARAPRAARIPRGSPEERAHSSLGADPGWRDTPSHGRRPASAGLLARGPACLSSSPKHDSAGADGHGSQGRQTGRPGPGGFGNQPRQGSTEVPTRPQQRPRRGVQPGVPGTLHDFWKRARPPSSDCWGRTVGATSLAATEITIAARARARAGAQATAERRCRSLQTESSGSYV